jgi:hypothetical protein
MRFKQKVHFSPKLFISGTGLLQILRLLRLIRQLHSLVEDIFRCLLV